MNTTKTKTTILLLIIAGLAGAGGGWLVTEKILKDKPPAGSEAAVGASELVGNLRPDFSLGSTSGEIISAADFDGQVLLINFWATWCKPCREEMPMLSGLHERLAGKGFTVLGIAMDDVQHAREFVDEFQITYPNAVGGVDVMATGVLYGNHSGLLPYSVLIDRSGIVRWTFLGELESSELEAQINGLL